MVGFSNFSFADHGYSAQPQTILDAQERTAFSMVMELILLETGGRAARERWQEAQLANLLSHAARRSAFWTKRLEGKKPGAVRLSRLPEMTREDLNAQVASEGALLNAADGVRLKKHATSGSTGVPAHFYVSDANIRYNEMRFFAQYLMEDRDLSLRRLKLRPQFPIKAPGFTFQQTSSYAGPFEKIFKTGINGNIAYSDPDLSVLTQKLRNFRPGYMICQSHLVEMIFNFVGSKFFDEIGLKMWVPIAAAAPDWVRGEMAGQGIAVRAQYSCEEMGTIATECPECPGCYHVASSNVIVEMSPDRITYEGVECGRLLVTHLHSYATPMIRYDIGDLGWLEERCLCGHNGQTLTALIGRLSTSLKRPDGRRTPFHIRGPQLAQVVPFKEYRIRQMTSEDILVEMVSPDAGDAAAERLKAYLSEIAGDEFNIIIKFVAQYAGTE